MTTTNTTAGAQEGAADAPEESQCGFGMPEAVDSVIDPKALDEHASIQARHFCIDEFTSQVIDLAAIAGTLGSTRAILDPLTRVAVPLSFSVLLLSAPMAGPAVLAATTSFRDAVQDACETKRRLTAPQLRARRIELETAAAGLLQQLRDPKIPLQQPLTMAVPREIAKKDQQAALLPDVERMADLLLEQELVQEPHLITDVVTSERIAELRNFVDPALFSLSPAGAALTTLLRAAPATRNRIAGCLLAGWTDSTVGVISNLWVADEVDALRAVTVIGDLLRTFVVIKVAGTDADVSISGSSKWDEFLLRLLKVRLHRERVTYELDEVGKREFLLYVNRVRKQRNTGSALASTWPQQALKIAGLLHVKSGGIEAAIIPGARLIEAVALMGHVEKHKADFYRRAAASGQEKAMAMMTEKVRKAGPLSKRALFRRYDCQDHNHLNPVLTACIEKGMIRSESDQFVAVAVPP